jgi:hypothetical protein
MSGDPAECRLRALQCWQMAQRATNQKAEQIFLGLQRSWNTLAGELEYAQAYLATLKATELGDAMECRARGSRSEASGEAN